MSDNTATEAKAAKGGPNPAPLSTVPAALTDPVAKAGRHLYDHIAPPVRQYVEHFEDLVHEARADRTAARRDATVNLADVLASLPHAKVLSDAPGRVRFSVGLLKGQGELARQTEEALSSVPGITQVSASPTTGSVLIHYKTRQYPSCDALVQVLKQLRVRGGKVVINHNNHGQS